MPAWQPTSSAPRRTTRTTRSRALDQAEREITHWRAHLERLQAGAQVPVAMQARRCASIVSALVGDAVNRTADAVCHAELPADALPA
jgi:hypothetical protein